LRRIGSPTHPLAALFNLIVEVNPSMFKPVLTLLVAGVGSLVVAPDAAAAACQSPQRVMGATPAQVRSHFAADGREVVTFLGYSGAGYADPAAMLAHAGRILGRLDPKRAVINIGATADGIGAVYPLAKQRGFTTTGIVSMEAARTGATLSPCVDLVFFVEDSTWGGYLPGTQTLSPTSEAMVTSSGRLIAIGGGDVARDELLAARSLGKAVSFIPADMNHVIAVKKAAHRGDPLPTDFRGAAGQAMQADSGQALGDPKAPVAGKVLGAVVRTHDAEELRHVVLTALTDRYARDKGIAVTPQEKSDYLRWLERIKRKDVEDNTARRDELTRRLAATSLSDTERKALTSELESVNQLLGALGEPGSAAAPDPKETEAREQIAAAVILQWKINRALYRQYGGRIIFQQGGPEPLDAYRKFLQEMQARGDFTILNKGIEAGFWHYYVTDSIHSFYPRGSAEEAQAFSAPPWSRARQQEASVAR
jgi:hypothetical protein